MNKLLVIGLALLLTPSSGRAAESLANPIELRIGQSHEIDDLVIGFDAVVWDSRCPLTVICVWEGEAVVSVWAESPGFAIERFWLSTHPASPEPPQQVEVFDHVVRIVALDPYPVHPNPIHPSLYVLTLTVEKVAPTSADAMSMSMAKGRYRY